MGPAAASVALLALLLLLRPPEAATASSFIPQIAGPYIAYIDHARPCSSPEAGAHWFHLRFSHFKPSRPLERQVWNGIANMTDSIDDTWWYRVVMDINSGNAWKENAFVFNFPRSGCSNFREHTPLDLNRISFANAKGKPCAIEKGVYRLVNKSISLQFPHFQVMHYGFYRFRLIGGRHDEKQPAVCSSFVCHVIPRPH